jgi:chitodextrinase
MMNKTLIVAGASALLAASADAAVVTRWNFNAGRMTASEGTGTASLVGTKSMGFRPGASADSAPGNNRALSFANFSTSVGQSGRRGVQFEADTSGFGTLTVGFSIGGQGRSSGWGQFQYSVNGGSTYTTADLVAGGRFKINADGTYRRIAFSLAFIDGVANSADFRFRIVAIANPSSQRFVAANGPSMLAAAFWKLDAVTVSGTALNLTGGANPAPGAIALLAVAGAVGATRRRA